MKSQKIFYVNNRDYLLGLGEIQEWLDEGWTVVSVTPLNAGEVKVIKDSYGSSGSQDAGAIVVIEEGSN